MWFSPKECVVFILFYFLLCRMKLNENPRNVISPEWIIKLKIDPVI